jgi:hypothetical protein
VGYKSRTATSPPPQLGALRQQRGAQEQPITNLDCDSDPTSYNSQHKAGSQRKHIEDHLLLQPGRIEQVDEPVAQEDERQGLVKQHPTGQREQQKRHRRPASHLQVQRTRCQRTEALCGVKAIMRTVLHVIEEVDGATDKAKENKTCACPPDARRRKKVA